MTLSARATFLASVWRRYSGGVLVALSGGVDSAVLLASAHAAWPGRVVGATTCSPAVPDDEVAVAADVARRVGVPHVVVATHELERADYRRNGGDRCYFCRVEMYAQLRQVAADHHLVWLADGLQADDLVADRAGVRAAAEGGVIHPLREAGLTKGQVRRLARAYGLPCHDKPAQPCLASRIPMGVPVTRARLARVEAAERAITQLGISVVRVRCEQQHGRVEVGRPELARAQELEGPILAAVRAAGFATAALDPRGYGAPV